MWEGIDPIHPIMPRWSWAGIDHQERLRDLTPEQAARIRRMPAEEQASALDDIRREHRQTMRGSAGMAERMQRMPIDEMDERTRSGAPTMDEARPDGGMRRPDDSGTDEGMSPEDETSAMPRGRDEAGMAPMRQSAGDDGSRRTEVELRPIPKSQRAPAPGETSVMSDNPVDAADTHLGMARSSAMAEDWESAKSHLRAAGEALDQIVARGDRQVQRYLDRLKADIRDMEKAVDARDRDLDVRLENLERNVRNLRPEER
jgi:hypothetical protein